MGLCILLVIALLLGWGYTHARLHDRINNLELSKDLSRRHDEQLFEAINGEWETREQFFVLLSALPTLRS